MKKLPKISGWNFRIVRTKYPGDGEDVFQIHEVYYDIKGNILLITQKPITPAGMDVEDLKTDLELMLRAFDKPIIDYDEVSNGSQSQCRPEDPEPLEKGGSQRK